MAGAGAGEFSEAQKNVIRYVVAMNSEFLDRTKLPWKVVVDDLVVYRGQSGKAEKKASIAGVEARTGWDRILTVFRDKPAQVSTSKQLNSHIMEFADGYLDTPPQGRLFQITVKRGVRYVDIDAERMAMGKLSDGSQDAKFQFIIDEAIPHWEREKETLIAAKLAKIKGTKTFLNALDKATRQATDRAAAEAAAEADAVVKATNQAKTQHYSSASTKNIRDIFVRNTLREREVLLDLAGTEFVRPDGSPESWAPGSETQAQYVKTEEKQTDGTYKQIISADTVPVYPTVLQPKPAGGRRSRGRTFRRKPMRRNKNGSRLARQSKRRRWNGHT